MVLRFFLTDVRLGSYLPSVIASAIMLCVVKEAEPPCDAFESEDQLTNAVGKSNEVCQCISALLFGYDIVF